MMEAGIAQASRPAERLMWLYVGTGLAIFAAMALMGLAMLAEQAHMLVFGPGLFYALMTLHATGMIIAVVLCSMGILWYVLYGEDYLDVRVAYWAYALMFAGIATVLLSVFPGGFSASWTYLFPLPFIGQSWASWATGAYFIGLTLITSGWSIWCIQILGCVLVKYGGFRGAFAWDLVFNPAAFAATGKEAPSPSAIAALVVSISGLITSADGMTIGSALVVHWLDPRVLLDPLWAKNLTYFFGHELANLAIYMAVVAIFVGLPRYTQRVLHTSAALVVAWWSTLIFVALAFFHHFYMDFAEWRGFQFVGEAASYLEALPVAMVAVFNGLVLVYRAPMRWTLGSMFLYAGLIGWVVGGMAALLDATVPFNLFLHNTLWVPAHFHTYLLEGVVLFILGWVFFMLEERSGKWSSLLIRWIAGSGVFGGGALFLAGFYIAGANGVPRRYAIQPAPGPELAAVATIGAAVLLAGLVVTLVEGARLALAPRKEVA